MSLFTERLEEEFQLMDELRQGSSRFEFTAFGSPPKRYEVTFRCKGLVGLEGDKPIYSNEHYVEINLHPDYPLAENSLEILWKTPILHPNIDLQHGPCIGGTPLGMDIRIAQICEFLAEMIQYLRYNPSNRWKSTTSRKAALWVQNHSEALPLDTTPLRDRADKAAEG